MINKVDILKKIIEEANLAIVAPSKGSTAWDARWSIIRVGYFKVINNPLTFSIGIGSDGSVWISKDSPYWNWARDGCFNLYEPGSLEEINKALKGIINNHEHSINS